MQHLWGIEHFASFAVVSKTFRNSSMGANFLMNFTVSHNNIALFNNILTPKSCMSLQFIHSLKINAASCVGASRNFADQLVTTKYLRLQLHTLSLDSANASLLSCFFSGPVPDQGWPQLQSLTIENASALNDSTLAIIAASVPSLTLLDLSRCVQVSDIGIQHIAKKHTALTSVNLSGCAKITDIGIRSIVANLSFLELHACDKITGVGFLSHATALTSLQLSCCKSIADVGLKCIAENVTLLTSLNLKGCSALTDAGLQHLNKLTSLATLDICWCGKITDEAVEKLKKDLPGCNVIY